MILFLRPLLQVCSLLTCGDHLVFLSHKNVDFIQKLVSEDCNRNTNYFICIHQKHT